MAVIFDSILYDVLFVLATFFVAAYCYFTRNFGYWKKRNIPYLAPKPFIGNFGGVIALQYSVGHYLHKLYNMSPDVPYFGIFAVDSPILIVKDPGVIKSILVKDASHFTDRNFSPSEDVEPLAAKMLLSVNGGRWKHLRTKLTPTFTSGKMKTMFYLVDLYGKTLVGILGEHSKSGEPVPVKEVMARFTTDVIAACAFGVEANAMTNANSEFRNVLRKIFEFDTRRFIMVSFSSLMPSLLKIFKQRVFDESVDDFVRKTLWGVVEYREKTGEVRNDFVDMLMQIRKDSEVQDGSGNLLKFEGDDFVAQAFLFLGAGFETSSTTLTFALYELALNPNVQTELRNEIVSVLAKHDGKYSYDAMMEMTYMDMVISETLRMYPPVTGLDRKCNTNYTIPGTNDVIEKDIPLFISLLGLHYDPKYFPKPEKFDPERFSADDKKNHHDYTYMPFGEGPRNCIGMRFGLMQVKTGLSYVLSNYEVQKCKETPIPMDYTVYSFTLNPKSNVPLIFQKLK